MNFYADTVEQHILLFAIGDQVSSSIVIDVEANQPSIYYQQPSYQPPIYNQLLEYQPSYYQPPGRQGDLQLHI
jgi:hypothetical protein